MTDFYLRDVDPRWEGQRFKELAESDRIRLRDSVLRATIVEQTDPEDNSSIYHIFERLNTGGTQLNPQEVRNSTAHGPFNDLMVELNNNADWRQVFGRPIPDPRMRDVELVVRFNALFEGSDSYSKPMKSFLNDFTKKHQSSTSVEPFQSVFTTTVARVLAALGPRSFHVRRGINAAVFDSVMVAFARSDALPSDMKSRWTKLLTNPSYDDLTRSSTTDVDTVKGRIDSLVKSLCRSN